ncbi:MAG: transcriptional activator NhaR [Deltaproteobacteria bacterium]|nr:transcriptional activator NhaR [Deltaproteobacteria bacterium]
MEWLNYHHLLYFWATAKEGGVGPAAERLRLTPQTISGQVRALEEALEEKLFVRRGRRLALTEMGRIVYDYADEIFGLGRELLTAVRGRSTGRAPRLVVGVAQVVPKLVAKRLLEPALTGEPRVRLSCREDATDRLLAELAAHRLDAVVLDAPVPPGAPVRAFNHLLGECGVTFFATPPLARKLARRFPQSLDGQPMLLPSEDTAIRRGLDEWLRRAGIAPDPVGDFDDSALLKAFGQAGHGVFLAPSAIADEVSTQYGVSAIGHTDDVRERFYVATTRRKLEHPAVATITEAARRELFAARPGG